MSRISKIAQAVGTLNVHPAGGGDTRDVLDAKINSKLTAENWDEVTSQVVTLNMSGNELTSVVLLYTYKKYDVEAEPTAKAKK